MGEKEEVVKHVEVYVDLKARDDRIRKIFPRIYKTTFLTVPSIDRDTILFLSPSERFRFYTEGLVEEYANKMMEKFFVRKIYESAMRILRITVEEERVRAFGRGWAGKQRKESLEKTGMAVSNKELLAHPVFSFIRTRLDGYKAELKRCSILLEGIFSLGESLTYPFEESFSGNMVGWLLETAQSPLEGRAEDDFPIPSEAYPGEGDKEEVEVNTPPRNVNWEALSKPLEDREVPTVFLIAFFHNAFIASLDSFLYELDKVYDKRKGAPGVTHDIVNELKKSHAPILDEGLLRATIQQIRRACRKCPFDTFFERLLVKGKEVGRKGRITDIEDVVSASDIIERRLSTHHIGISIGDVADVLTSESLQWVEEEMTYRPSSIGRGEKRGREEGEERAVKKRRVEEEAQPKPMEGEQPVFDRIEVVEKNDGEDITRKARFTLKNNDGSLGYYLVENCSLSAFTRLLPKVQYESNMRREAPADAQLYCDICGEMVRKEDMEDHQEADTHVRTLTALLTA